MLNGAIITIRAHAVVEVVVVAVLGQLLVRASAGGGRLGGRCSCQGLGFRLGLRLSIGFRLRVGLGTIIGTLSAGRLAALPASWSFSR